MQTTWNILVKELAIFGINLIDANICECTESGKTLKVPIRYKLRLIRKAIKQNIYLLEEIWSDLGDLLNLDDLPQPIATVDVLDVKSTNLFINSLECLMRFSIFLLDDYAPYFKEPNIEGITKTLRHSLDLDIKNFSKNIISLIPGFRLSIDWLHRIIRQLMYISKLLRFASSGQETVSMLPDKFAKGVQGPWGNLDLPMKEREFEWSDIEEEVRGRDRDIRKQRRYRMGLESYNNDGRVGEGFMWREIRNEPFSWYDRGTEDPYPGRSILTRS